MHELWSHGAVASLGGRALGYSGGELAKGLNIQRVVVFLHVLGYYVVKMLNLRCSKM